MSTDQGSFVSLAVADGGRMRAYVARPSGAPRGGIIVFQEAFGVNGYIRSIADRLANEGYLAIAPELFHRTAGEGFEAAYGNFEPIKPHFAGLSEAGLEADARAAHGWLTGEGGIAEGEVRAIGFCMGGRVAFIADSILPLKAAVSFYGAGIDQLTARAKDLHAPIMLLWGGKDAHIGPDKRRAVSDALDAAGKSHVDVVCSDADHGFFCDARPSFHPRSAAVVWPMVLEFLK